VSAVASFAIGCVYCYISPDWMCVASFLSISCVYCYIFSYWLCVVTYLVFQSMKMKKKESSWRVSSKFNIAVK